MTKVTQHQTSEEWLTLREACALIGVSPATLRRWSDSGDIRTFTTPGGHRRFARSAIVGLLPAVPRHRPTLASLGESPEHMIRACRHNLTGRGKAIPWISELGDSEIEDFRAVGRRIVTSLLGSLDAESPEQRKTAIEDAARSAAEHGRLAGRCGAGMSQTVEAFLHYRLPFLHELAALARRRGLSTTEATDLLETATRTTDLLLSSLMSGHAAADGEL